MASVWTWVIGLLLVPVVAWAEAGEITLTSTIEPTSARLGEPITVAVTLGWPGAFEDANVEIPDVLESPQFTTDGVGRKVATEVVDGQSRTVYTVTYTLLPNETGAITIPEIPVGVTPVGSLDGEDLLSEGATVTVRPPPKPFPWRPIGIGLGLTLAAGALVYAGWTAAEYWRRKANEEPVLTPSEEAAKNLRNAWSKLDHEPQKPLYDQIEFILLHWLAEEHGLETRVAAGDEIARQAEDVLGEREGEVVTRALQAIDDVKFAGATPPKYQSEILVDDLLGLFEGTLNQEPPSDATE